MKDGTPPIPQMSIAQSPSGQPGDAVLSAINDLAEQVRGMGLHRADELLAELLIELHATSAGKVHPAGQAGWED